MFGVRSFRLVLAAVVLPLILLAGCGRELTRSLAPKPEGRGVAAIRGGAAMDAVGAPRNDAGKNLPPYARILSPFPSRFFTHRLRPPVTIEWTGQDPDGHVREYRYRLFAPRNPDRPDITDFIEYLTQNPDSVLRYYAPDFQGWERSRVHGRSEPDSVTYPTLDPAARYAFAVVAIDNRGDHDTLLSTGRNILSFVTYPQPGPELTIMGPFGEVTLPSGSPPQSVVVPAGQPVTVHWFATPRAGTVIKGYQSGIDQFPYLGEPSLEDTTATISPPTSGDGRTLYVLVAIDQPFAPISTFVLRLSFTGSPLTATGRSGPPPIPMARIPSP
jgi:hypothetical protein